MEALVKDDSVYFPLAGGGGGAVGALVRWRQSHLSNLLRPLPLSMVVSWVRLTKELYNKELTTYTLSGLT